jgi:excisionase family DNA binding protein
MSEKDYLTIADVAKLLDCSRTQVYRYIAKGDLSVSRNPIFSKGARVRIPRADVDALIARALGIPSEPPQP